MSKFSFHQNNYFVFFRYTNVYVAFDWLERKRKWEWNKNVKKNEKKVW